jgi:hypothetical protein
MAPPDGYDPDLAFQGSASEYTREGGHRVSVWVVSTETIDAIVTVALRWTESGVTEYMPAEAADVLRVTPENATEVGTRLLRANYDQFNYGGPRERLTPEEIAETPEYQPEYQQEMPQYTFAEFPGNPSPVVVVRLTDYYRYQTQNDYWTESYTWLEPWTNGGPPFEARFIFAMRWYAMAVLGLAPADQMPAATEERAQFPADRFPAYDRVPWGLGEGDRQLFTSIT